MCWVNFKTYEEIGGKVVNIGKPYSPIFSEAIEKKKKKPFR